MDATANPMTNGINHIKPYLIATKIRADTVIKYSTLMMKFRLLSISNSFTP
ncbi:hypothetical protein GCM10008903_11360 [Clostridium cadaveris]